MSAFRIARRTPEQRRRVLLALLGVCALALAVQRAALWWFDPRPRNGANHVLVYTTSWCPVCKRLRACFSAAGVPFEERDIERSRRWEAEWWAGGAIGVPFTVVGGEVAHGLRREQVEPLLARAGYRVDCWSGEAWRAAAEAAAPR